METFIETLYEELNDELQTIAANAAYSPIHKAVKSAAAVKASIRNLKDFILSYSFADEKEEISFFKHKQPQFYSLLIYYTSIASIETRIPVGAKESKEIFYKKELSRIRNFFDRNVDIYKYYRLEAEYFDPQYFLRANVDSDLLIGESCLFDARFVTTMSHLYARIKANELLESYLKLKIDELKNISPPMPRPLKWRGKKVLLAEVIYLFHANGLFGNVQLKLISDTISRDWNCPISNIYKPLEEIRIRKKNRLAGLHQLLVGLERKMNEDDLNAR